MRSLVILSLVLVFAQVGFANSRKISRDTSAASRTKVTQDPTKAIPELISFQELQALDKIKKEKYLIQLQNLMSHLSATEGFESSSEVSRSQWPIFLGQLLEEAQARGMIYGPGSLKDGKCGPGYVLQRNGRALSCGLVKTCPAGQVLVSVSEDGPTCQPGATNNSCGDNMVVMTDTESRANYCLPKEAVPWPANTPFQKEMEQLGQMIKEPFKANSQAPSTAPASEAAPAPASESAVKDEAVLPTVEVVSPKSTTKCWWEDMKKCESSSKAKKKIAKDWYNSKAKEGELSCIYAGNVSSYKNPKKPKPGECKAVSEATFGEKKFSCPEGQSLCSPLIFGVKDYAKNEGYCTKGKNATQECASKGSALATMGLLQNLGATAGAEWERLKAGLKNVVANCILEDKEKNKVSINSKAFQCQECQIIAARVADMKASLNSKLSELSCELTATGSVAEVDAVNAGLKAAPQKATK
jgi:hypothetical protein